MTCRKIIPGGRVPPIAGRLAAIAVAVLMTCRAGAQLPRQDFPQPVLETLRISLAAYEDVRGELASDQLEGLSASAGRLADAFRGALDGRAELAAGIPKIIEEAALSAESLAKAEDLVAARTSFGEVSRRILLLAGSDSRLVEGRHVFACPMVKTFPKWIQPSEDLDNPYMGKAMPACGFSADWSAPASIAEKRPSISAEGSTEAETDSAPEPIFKPGIPGLKMVDVRDHKFLWREIEDLQRWERGDRISVAEYRSKVIEKTAHFLGFGGAGVSEFSTAAGDAVSGIRESFQLMQRLGENPGAAGTRFSSDLGESVSRVVSLLQGAPRHQLFQPECKKWLLKLAFGPREDKEAKERGSGS